MAAKAAFCNPPPSVHSGKPLRGKLKVNRRCDQFVEEQLDRVNEAQNALNRALLDLDLAVDPTQSEICWKRVAALKHHCDKMMLILKLIQKLNSEVHYAHSEVDKAIKSHLNADTARKRLHWLEGRMMSLVGRPNPFAEETDGNKTSHTGAVVVADVSNSTWSGSIPVTPEWQFLTSSQTVNDDGRSEVGDNISRSSGTPSEKPDSEKELAKYAATLRNVGLEQMINSSLSSKSASVSEHESQHSNEVQESNENENDIDKEISVLPVERENKADEDAKLESDSYWHSEHHRFEYSQQLNELLRINPNSYHLLGVAVAGSFVNDVPWSEDGLSNRSAGSGGGQNALHYKEISLLRERMKTIHSQIHDAAQLSAGAYNTPALGSKTQTQSTVALLARSKTLDVHQQQLTNQKRSVTLPALLPSPTPLNTVDNSPIHKKKNTGVLYPRSSTCFSQSVAGVTAVPESVVNYEALQKEMGPKPTLYRPRKVNEYKVLQDKRQAAAASSSSARRSYTMSSKSTTFAPDERKKTGDTAKSSYHGNTQSADGRGSDWSQLKPHSGPLHHSGLKWERVKDIVHTSLVSVREEERLDAVRQLRELKCCDTMVVHSLKQRLLHDNSPQITYEATKALVALGFLDDDVMRQVIGYLRSNEGNTAADLLHTLTDSRSLFAITVMEDQLEELTDILVCFCKEGVEAGARLSMSSVHGAMCLATLAIANAEAEQLLRNVITNDACDKHLKAKILPLLVDYTTVVDWSIVRSLMDQLDHCTVWTYRKEAAKLLAKIGRDVIIGTNKFDEVFTLLERKLWDEPMREVRKQVAKTVAVLGVFPVMCERVERQLRDPVDDIRAHAAVCVATLDMNTDRIMQMLLDMVDLDNSKRVKKAVLQTLLYFKCTDWRVLRAKDRILTSDG